MKFRFSIVLLLAFILTLQASASSLCSIAGVDRHSAASRLSKLPLKPSVDQAWAAQLSAHFLTRFQYGAKPLDKAMSVKIYKAYLKLLDGAKMFFTQQDINRFAKYREKLDTAIWNHDLTAPFYIFNQYVISAVRQMRYARSLLNKGFNFRTHAIYHYDRTHASWPKNRAALNRLWYRRTMNDWIRLRLGGKSKSDIVQILGRRYCNSIDHMRQLDGQDAFQIFMNAYARSTDPHTDYFGPRMARNFAIAMRLSLEGIGAVLQFNNEYTRIRALVPGGPAARSGRIHVGDRIVGVGQNKKGPIVDVIGWRLDDVVDLVRGKKGSVVRLEIIPAATGLDGKHQRVTLVRNRVTVAEQAARKKLMTVSEGGVKRKIGVIELPSFYSDFRARYDGNKHFKSATRDVIRLLRALKAEGVQGFILDLRNNGGGSLYEAKELTGLFIGKGPVVQVRDARGKVDVQSDKDLDMARRGPLAVLVNRGTASASEIFSAAIQDYGRGLVVGTPTFGKGTVQNLINLESFAKPVGQKHLHLGQLKMTIAEFFRVGGASTQLKGVIPDIRYPQNGDAKILGEATYNNALPWSHIMRTPYKPVADMQAWLPQLRRMHNQRVAKSPAWKLMLDKLAQYRKNRNHTTVSLNFSRRLAERKKMDTILAAFRKRQQAIDGNSSALVDVHDDGLIPSERSLKQQLQQERDAQKAADPALNETAHILFDAIGLIKTQPKLAAKVQPYARTRHDNKPVAAIWLPPKNQDPQHHQLNPDEQSPNQDCCTA